MSHLSAVVQKYGGLVSEKALNDYIHTIREDNARRAVEDPDDLLSFQKKLQAKKGYGGNDT